MPTINDIAKRCGINKSTVSRVINNTPGKVSARTREQVLLAIREMGYQPSVFGRALSMKRSNTIGVVTWLHNHLLAMPYFAAIVSAVLDEATQAGMTMALFNGNVFAPQYPGRLIFSDGRCDGLIIIGSWKFEGLVDALLEAGLPFVAVNSGELPDGCDSLDIDNVDAGRIATQHLIDLGHKRIAFCDDSAYSPFSRQRYDGYAAAMSAAGLAVDERLLLNGDSTESSYQRGLRAAGMVPDLTAIFCTGDQIALSLIQGLRDADVRVPAQVSVLGINGETCGEVSAPKLTTVSQRLEDLGTEAARMLLARIEDRSLPPRNIVWPIELVVRESTAPPLG
ncbi:MAG: LacI family DNA-binding transcriptional regulator [Capsulimonadaceae bacterium]|nr:LacI family DNA-binding transcriptional regulator [Capsulimonadaceae bacterium]